MRKVKLIILVNTQQQKQVNKVEKQQIIYERTAN